MTEDELDILSDEPAAQASASIGLQPLQQLYRLVRLSAMHALDNQAVLQALEQTVEAARQACREGGGRFVTAFSGDAVFVNEKLLKAPRLTYEQCREVGAALARVGANELTLHESIDQSELLQLLLRIQQGGGGPPELDSPSVGLRQVEIELPTAIDFQADVPEQVVRAYASAVVLMQRIQEPLLQGQAEAFRTLKRIALQLIAAQVEAAPERIRDLVVLRCSRREEAHRAVNAAILAVLAARHVSSDRRFLLRTATAALAYDLGRVRAAGAKPGRLARIANLLNDDQKDRLPEATAYAALSAASQMNDDALTWALVLFEAHVLSRANPSASSTEMLQGISVEAALISLARRLVDEVSAAALPAPISPGEAAGLLWRGLRTPLEKQALELLLAVLDVVPPEAVVELESGWLARVVRIPADPRLARQPTVQLLRAPSGHVPPPGEIDLLETPEHGRVVRVVQLPEASRPGPPPSAPRRG